MRKQRDKRKQSNNTCIVDTIWIFWAPLGHRDLVPTSSMLTVTSNAPTPKATEDPGLALEHLGEPRGVGDTSLESDTQHCCLWSWSQGPNTAYYLKISVSHLVSLGQFKENCQLSGIPQVVCHLKNNFLGASIQI